LHKDIKLYRKKSSLPAFIGRPEILLVDFFRAPTLSRVLVYRDITAPNQLCFCKPAKKHYIHSPDSRTRC